MTGQAPRIIVADYDVVTPMFMGGASQHPQWRLASYAHALRWWWRALALGRFDGDLRKVKLNEALLFGHVEKGYGAGRVRFRDLTAQIGDAAIPPAPWGDQVDGGFPGWSGLAYLAGQGLQGRKATPISRLRIELRIAWRDPGALKCAWDRTEAGGETRPFADTDIDEAKSVDTLKDAVVLIGLLGGLGARSRRGFGSLTITRMEDDRVERPVSASDHATYASLIASTAGASIDWRPAEIPPYSAFFGGMNSWVIAEGGDAKVLLNRLGWALQYFRGWGQPVEYGHRHFLYEDDKVFGGLLAGAQKQKYAFAADHDWLMRLRSGDFDSGALLPAPPRKSVFGLPQMYRDGVAIEVAGSNADRRASPLTVHIHRLGSGAVIACCTVLKADFLAPDTQVAVRRGKKSFPPAPIKPDWQAVHAFSEFAAKFLNAARKGESLELLGLAEDPNERAVRILGP